MRGEVWWGVEAILLRIYCFLGRLAAGATKATAAARVAKGRRAAAAQMARTWSTIYF